MAVFRGFDQFDEIEVTPMDLMSQSILLIMMKWYLNGERLEHQISSIVDSCENIDLDSIAFINCIYAVFGKKVFVLAGAICGNGNIIEKSDGFRVIIEKGEARCIKKLLISKNAFKKFNMDQFAGDSCRMLEKQGIQSVIMIKGQPQPTLMASVLKL
jgi:hypothetical protein